MTLKIKDKKLFGRNFFKRILYHEKIRITRVFLWIKDPDPDQGDPKRPDPTGSESGSATLFFTNAKVMRKITIYPF